MKVQKLKEKPMRVGRTAEWKTSPNCDLAIDSTPTKVVLSTGVISFCDLPSLLVTSLSGGKQSGKVTEKRSFKILLNLLIFSMASHCCSLLYLPLLRHH